MRFEDQDAPVRAVPASVAGGQQPDVKPQTPRSRFVQAVAGAGGVRRRCARVIPLAAFAADVGPPPQARLAQIPKALELAASMSAPDFDQSCPT